MPATARPAQCAPGVSLFLFPAAHCTGLEWLVQHALGICEAHQGGRI